MGCSSVFLYFCSMSFCNSSSVFLYFVFCLSVFCLCLFVFLPLFCVYEFHPLYFCILPLNFCISVCYPLNFWIFLRILKYWKMRLSLHFSHITRSLATSGFLPLHFIISVFFVFLYFSAQCRKSTILKSGAAFALTLPPPWQHLAPPSRIIHMLCNNTTTITQCVTTRQTQKGSKERAHVSRCNWISRAVPVRN